MCCSRRFTRTSAAQGSDSRKHPQQPAVTAGSIWEKTELSIHKQGVTQARGCDDGVIIITAYSLFFSQTELFMEFKLKSKINCETVMV